MTIGLIGNPNCGKTTLFNGLTGARQHIGNWPGVTVEKKEGAATLPGGETVRVVDLPGVYSLTATSEDERATLEYVLSHEADLYVNVLDATTLERNLYLTLLMCELQAPLVVVVTMLDIARQRNISVDLDHLSQHLGVPVLGVNANNPLDVRRLGETLARALAAARPPTIRLDYGNELEREIDLLASCTVKTAAALKVSRRWVALKALEGEPLVTKALLDYHDMAPEVVEGAVARVTEVLKDPPDIELAEARYGVIAGLVRDVVRVHPSKQYVSERIDRFVLNRVLALPLFLAIMAGVFALVLQAAGAPTDLFDRIGTAVFQRAPALLLAACRAPDGLVAVVANGIGGALTALFSFVPVIFCMFFALAILEDSGYMARAAFLADRFMRALGLPGKSFVPLLVGFGCSVPAIMATRTLESRRDRMLTIFMIPFMSCGAKLPVYAAFAVAFSPAAPGRMLLALYLAGIALGVATGLLLKKTLFRGEPAHFIMELPPYHVPRLRHILLHTWERLTGFLWRAGRFIVPVMLVLGLLNSFDVRGRACVGGDVSDKTVLAAVGRALTPVFAPIGVERENWPASVAVFTGLGAKESVIGTLNGLYSQMARPAGQEGAGASKAAELAERGEMRRHFPKGFHQAFAYLLFVLLYMPCLGATALVFKEVGRFYGCVFVAYLTALGWSVATVYHALMVSHDVVWLAAGGGLLALMSGFFWLYGRVRRVDMPADG